MSYSYIVFNANKNVEGVFNSLKEAWDYCSKCNIGVENDIIDFIIEQWKENLLHYEWNFEKRECPSE